MPCLFFFFYECTAVKIAIYPLGRFCCFFPRLFLCFFQSFFHCFLAWRWQGNGYDDDDCSNSAAPQALRRKGTCICRSSAGHGKGTRMDTDTDTDGWMDGKGGRYGQGLVCIYVLSPVKSCRYRVCVFARWNGYLRGTLVTPRFHCLQKSC